jgi:tRNA-dihydrouridine synthase
MIGRSAIGNPWIFAGLDREKVPVNQVRETMLAHLDSMLSFYGAELGLVLFRKHASRYITPFGLTNEQREMLLTAKKPEEFVALLNVLAISEMDIAVSGA